MQRKLRLFIRLPYYYVIIGVPFGMCENFLYMFTLAWQLQMLSDPEVNAYVNSGRVSNAWALYPYLYAELYNFV